MIPMQKCGYHCRDCGRHFVSLTAFDKHHTGPLAKRRCGDPADLEMVSTKGVCQIAGPKKQEGDIWTTRSLSP